MNNLAENFKRPIWLQDYHLHTAATIDGYLDETEVCERAMEMNINEIAFTNHVMLVQSNYLISPASLSKHWDRIQECQLKYPSLQIRLGLEVDYYPNREVEIKETIEKYELTISRPFDIILGSVHQIRDGFFSNRQGAEGFFKECDIHSIYLEYFDLVRRAAESRIYDVMAHPDLIKKYTGELTPRLPFEQYVSAVEPFISALIKNQVGIEVNTKGLQMPIHEPYPSRQFLELYIQNAKLHGFEPIITIGSDAHKLKDVGSGIREGMELLEDLKIHSITSFTNRKRYLRKISL